MNFDLDPEHAELQRQAREFCQKEIAPKAQANDVKETFHWETVPALRRMGYFGITFPKKYGGLGLDELSLCLILEELGAADAAAALTIESHNGLCTNHIYLNGNEEQKAKYLPLLTSGEMLGGWALTEPGSGSDAGAAKTKAVFDGKQWILNGSKTFTTQGSVAGVYVVFAQTGDPDAGKKELTAFLIDKGTPGFTIGKIEHKMGIRSSDTAQLHLHDVRLAPDRMIGLKGKAFGHALKILDGGRVAISGISVGIARSALDEGLRWVAARKGDYGIVPENPGLTFAQKTLAQIAAEVDAARLLTHRAACLMDAGRPFSKEASMAKLISGDLAMRAPTDILDVIGPEGASLDCPVQRAFRDAKLYQIGEGSSQIQQLVISRMLLADKPRAEDKKKAAAPAS